jgi:hypothetical protein
MATFNGDRFLREQIESILSQDYGNLRVLARDDGSSDKTVEVLNEYAVRFPSRFKIVPTILPTGNARDNFLNLMEAATADYICFCDQDDVWLPHKITKTKQAMDLLESRWGASVPLLVFTDLRLVDEELNPIHGSFWANMRIDPACMNNFSRLLVRSVVSGCTVMINRQLLELSKRTPKEASMHDRWVALLVSAMGRYSFVRTPTVLYRQHDRNVLGTGATRQTRSLLQRVLSPTIAQKHFMQWRVSQRQAAAFLRLHAAELTAEKRNIVEAYLRCETSGNRFERIATLIRYGFFYSGFLPNLLTVVHLWNTHKVEDRDRDV